jgi:hypothetical protein
MLSLVVDYWNDYWELPPHTIPSPGGQAVSKRERAAQLHNSPYHRRGSWLISTKGISPATCSDPDWYLLYRIIDEAYRDFSRGVLSQSPEEHRNALNAYWWVFGLPWPLPAGVSPYEVRRRVHQAPEEVDPFEYFGLPVETLFRGCSPARMHEHVDPMDRQLIHDTSFEEMCLALDLDPMGSRKMLAVSPPPSMTTRNSENG